VICQQINSLSVKPRGFSEVLAKAYPYSNTYANRKRLGRKNLCIESDRDPPGTIRIYQSPCNPTIVNLVAQYRMGKPGKWHQDVAGPEDTKMERTTWFRECLIKLVEFVNNSDHIKSVYFPSGIGCSMVGGDWNIYSQMIQNFANMVKVKVIIVKYLEG
jgi:hypothetical protein